MTAAIELETFLAHLSRPGATPAPAAGGETGPGTSDARPGPRVDDIAGLADLLDRLREDGRRADTNVIDLHAAINRSRAARGLGEVA